MLVLGATAWAGGCGPGTGVAVGNAVLNTGIAAGASAVRRAEGDCYVPCDHGTVCNYETGYCDPLPCGEACDVDELCDTTQPIPRCMPAVDLSPEHSEGG